MGAMIEQIRIGKTRKKLSAASTHPRFGPDPLITIPARGFWKCRNFEALQKTAFDHTKKGSKTSCTTGGNHRSFMIWSPTATPALHAVFHAHQASWLNLVERFLTARVLTLHDSRPEAFSDGELIPEDQDGLAISVR